MNDKNDESATRSVEARHGPIPGPVILSLTIIAVAVIAAAGGFFFGRGKSSAAALPVLGRAPSYELTNQLGQKVSSTAFAGKIQVVTFFDPYCSDFCPLISVNLANFAADFRASPLGGKIVFVAFNVDPWQTGVKEMRGFLEQYGWSPKTPDMEFLTGSVAQMRRIVQHGFYVAFQRVPSDDSGDAPVSGTAGHLQLSLPNPMAEKAKPRYDIVHNDTIEIVDGKGRIRKIFGEGDRVSDEQLMHVIDALQPTIGPG